MISNYSISFHDSNIQFLNKTVDKNFGLLHFTVTEDKDKCINNHIHIILNIDQSGSMSDECKDGRTKMRHLLFTIENMLRLFHKHNNTNGISIYIQSFDDTVIPIFTDTNSIQDQDIEILINKIKNITPIGSTDIGKALMTSKKHIEEYLVNQDNTNHEIVHILLTDGEITSGITDIDLLRQSICVNNCNNIFIGYGKTHDSSLLSKLASSSRQGQYRFIDILENAGLVYGEIVHGILYKVLKNVYIECENSEIYDYNTNLWTNMLNIDDLSCEQTKDYQIRSLTSCVNDIKIYLKKNTGEIICEFINSVNKKEDLTKYLYRQKTQELLYKSRMIEENPKCYEEKKNMKKELKNFLDILNDYMKSNNLLQDPFYKMLSDDIYICYKTIGTYYGNMFIYARQTSQGRQQTYTCSSINDDEPMITRNAFRNINKYFDKPSSSRQISFNPSFVNLNDDVEPVAPKHKYISDLGIINLWPSNNNLFNNDTNNNDDTNNFDDNIYYNDDNIYENDNTNNFDDNYTLSNTPISPYKTKGIVDMMTTLSQCD